VKPGRLESFVSKIRCWPCACEVVVPVAAVDRFAPTHSCHPGYWKPRAAAYGRGSGCSWPMVLPRSSLQLSRCSKSCIFSFYSKNSLYRPRHSVLMYPSVQEALCALSSKPVTQRSRDSRRKSAAIKSLDMHLCTKELRPSLQGLVAAVVYRSSASFFLEVSPLNVQNVVRKCSLSLFAPHERKLR
jgi:hypothetical protein